MRIPQPKKILQTIFLYILCCSYKWNICREKYKQKEIEKKKKALSNCDNGKYAIGWKTYFIFHRRKSSCQKRV